MRRAYANEVVRKLTGLFGKAFRSMGFGEGDGKRKGLKFSFVDKIEDGRRTEASNAEIERISSKFDSDIQRQIDGTLDEGYVYDVGHPGNILRSTGIPDVPIQLNAARLKFKSEVAHHKFDISEVKGLVKSIQDPVAVFSYGDKTKSQNIVIEVQHGGKNFVVGISLRPVVNGSVLDINSIRTIYPKDNHEWFNWIVQGKALYINKEKVQVLFGQYQRNPDNVPYFNLDSARIIAQNFVNPQLHGNADQIPLRDASNNIVGSFNRRTGEVKVLNGVDPNVAASALTHEIAHAATEHKAWYARAWDAVKRAVASFCEKAGITKPDAEKKVGLVKYLVTQDGVKEIKEVPNGRENKNGTVENRNGDAEGERGERGEKGGNDGKGFSLESKTAEELKAGEKGIREKAENARTRL